MDMSEIGVIRRSEKRNLRSLLELSMQTVVLNLPRYCRKDDDEPFACLPSDIMTILTETEKQYRKSMGGALHAYKYKMYCTSLQMISWNTQRVYLEAFGWEIEVIKTLIKRIMYKCADTLLTLQLSYCSPHVDTTLQRLLPRLLKLRKLEVNGRLGTDDLLAGVGEHLDQLRELSMDSSSLTDQGIEYLCKPHHKYGKCKHLEIVHLNSTNQVTSYGILTLLDYLPNLKHVHHRQLVKAIFMYLQKSKYKKLKLEGEIFGKQEKLKITNENINNFLEILPNLKNLNFFHELLINIDIIAFKNNTNIHSIEINIGIIPLRTFNELVQYFNHKLQIIKIESINISIDISIISKFCTNLQEFHYKCKTNYSLEYEIKNAFTNIKTVFLEDLTGNIPENILNCILRSENLKFVTFVRTIKLTDEILSIIFELAKSDTRIFSNLKLLRFCLIPNISNISMRNFICLAPLLESLEVTACNNINSEEYTTLLEYVIDMGWEDEIEIL